MPSTRKMDRRALRGLAAALPATGVFLLALRLPCRATAEDVSGAADVAGQMQLINFEPALSFTKPTADFSNSLGAAPLLGLSQIPALSAAASSRETAYIPARAAVTAVPPVPAVFPDDQTRGEAPRSERPRALSLGRLKKISGRIARWLRPGASDGSLAAQSAAEFDAPLAPDDRRFLEQADKKTGLVADRAPRSGGLGFRKKSGRAASVAATGFGLSALSVGAKRGWIPRRKALARARKTLKFLAANAAQERGWFYHFLDARTGARAWNSEVSSIDTALLLAGAMTAKQFFGDAEISRLADDIYARVDFPWMLNGSPNLLSMGWTPEQGFISARWDTYSEHMVLCLLAMGSPTRPIPASAWDAWARPEVGAGGQSFIAGTAPLFIHQYSHAYVDFRGKRDRRGLDYFENSVKATLAQRQVMSELGQDPSGKYAGWSKDIWGLTSSDDGKGGYAAWGAPPLEGPIDGTVVPSAPGGSLMFTPKESLAALRAIRKRYPKTYGRYGFADSFHPATGRVNKDVLGIDAGITLLSAANLTGGDVWESFMKNHEIIRAMKVAGFKTSGR